MYTLVCCAPARHDAKMADEQVMFAASGFTERNQVLRVKLQVRMEVEGLDVMDL